MIESALVICYISLTIAFLLGCYRLVVGPDILDRLLAFDFLSSTIIGLIVIISIASRTMEYIEVILIFSLLGFATVISFMEVFFYLSGRERNG